LSQTPSEFSLQISDLAIELGRNIIGYCRTITDITSKEIGNILFDRDLDGIYNETREQLIGTPRLSVLVIFLSYSLDLLQETERRSDKSSETLNNIPDLKEKDLNQYLTEEEKTKELTAQQLQKIVQRKLIEIQHQCSKTITSLYYIIENTLLILWKYLDHFLKENNNDSKGLEEFRNEAKKILRDDNRYSVEGLLNLKPKSQPNIIRIIVRKILELLK